MATKQIQYTPPVIESKADPAHGAAVADIAPAHLRQAGKSLCRDWESAVADYGLAESNQGIAGEEMITLQSNTPIAIAPRSGVSPIGTTSPNSGATAATNSTYGVGVFTSGISEQSGASYTLQNTDYQGVIIFDSGATVNVTLNSNVTPNFQATILNLDSGAIALATSDGSAINNGPSSLTLASGQGVQVFFANRAWLAYAGTTVIQIVPQSIGPVAHEWLNSYNATTGLFTESQPAFSDVSGIATTGQIGTGTPAAGKYVDGGTGAWTALPVVNNYHSVTSASYSSTASDRIIGVNYAGSVSVSLINASSVPPGTIIVVKDESGNAGTNNITINPQSGQTIEGASNQLIVSGYDDRRMYSNGSNAWFLI